IRDDLGTGVQTCALPIWHEIIGRHGVQSYPRPCRTVDKGAELLWRHILEPDQQVHARVGPRHLNTRAQMHVQRLQERGPTGSIEIGRASWRERGWTAEGE